jgi:Cu/Ag efflux pump CusA
MRSALGYATLAVLLAMLPVFFTSGLTGAFVHPLALSYALAVLASMVVALVVTPGLSVMVFSRPARRAAHAPILALMDRSYLRTFPGLVRRGRTALVAASVLLLVGVGAAALLHQHLRPAFQDRQLLVKWNATPSTSLPEMDRITARATAELRAVPGVRTVGAHVGRAVTSDQPVGTGSGELWVTMAGSADYHRTARAIQRVVGSYPGIRGTVLTYENERSRDVLGRPDDGLVVRVFGQEIGVLDRQAQRVRDMISGVSGVQRARVQSPVMQPTLQIEVDLATARRYGIKPGDVRRAAAALVAGIEVGSFFEHQKVFQVVVRGTADTHASVTSIRRLLIDTPRGGHVRIGDVARVAVTPNPVDIRHDSVSRFMDVRADVQGRGLSDVQDDVRQRLRSAAFPFEYHAEVIPASADLVAPAGRFVSLAVAAAIGILLLLQTALGSWRLAALVAVTLPVALVGGVVVALVHGSELSLGEAVGLFTVFAIAVRGAIVLLRRFEHLEREEQEPPGPAVVVQGTRDRLAPIVITAAVTAAAMLPIAVMGDVAGNEVTQPMALVVLGGLVTSTLLNLYILPTLYLHYGQHPGTRADVETEPVAPPATIASPQAETAG